MSDRQWNSSDQRGNSRHRWNSHNDSNHQERYHHGGGWRKPPNRYKNNRGYSDHRNSYRDRYNPNSGRGDSNYHRSHYESYRHQECKDGIIPMEIASTDEVETESSKMRSERAFSNNRETPVQVETVASSATSASSNRNNISASGYAPKNTSVEVITKSFAEMSWKEKLETQLESTFLELTSVPEEVLGKHKDDYLEEKKNAFNIAVKKVNERLKMIYDQENGIDEDDEDEDDEDSDDFSDDGDGPYSKKRKAELKYSQKQVIQFFKSLIDNIVFDMGFRVSGADPKEEKNCWCPCGRHMASWRKLFHIEGFAGKGSAVYCDGSSKMSPIGLMGHLRKKGEDCPLHYGITVYMEKLYGSLRGTGHKGLYIMGDPRYKKAEAAEKKELLDLYHRALRQKNEAERRAHEAEMEIKKREEEKKEWMNKLKEINPNFCEKVQDLDECFNALKIEEGDEEVEHDDKQLDKWDKFVEKSLKNIRFGVNKTKPENRIMIRVKQYFSGYFDINQVFQTMEKTKNSLFTEVNLERVLDWEVQFEAYNNEDEITEVIKVTEGGKDEEQEYIPEYIPVDQGGPTRQFISLVWKYLEDLCLIYKVKKDNKEIYLFEMTSGGIVPISNEFLENKISVVNYTSDKDIYNNILKRIKSYYRVIGIIMFRAIVDGIAIPGFVMPNFYRNVILRNMEPKDLGEFSKRQMLIDLADVGLNYEYKKEKEENSNKDTIFGGMANHILKKSVKELKQSCVLGDGYDDDLVIDEDSFFTVFLQDSVIKSHSIYINAIRLGFSLDDQVDLQSIFSMTSLKFVTEKAFAKPIIDVDDLIDVLILIPAERQEITKTQKRFFHTTLKEVIREMSDDKREQFLFFCTGYNHLPRRKNKERPFVINVECNWDEMQSVSLPVAHTCINLIKLPGDVYQNDKKIFQRKLFEAMMYSKGFSQS